ncbi:hypothetical protein [Chitinophaga varians]|nr:hypothetical protein [Chitinophaga varians]
MKKLSQAGLMSIPVVIICLATLWFFPMWRIDMRAPQYPDGLSMQIWINDVKGDVPIINGLNHYIGMKTIHQEDFLEFVFMPVSIAFFMAAGILIMVLKKKILYYCWTGIFLVIALLSFGDFYRWEYNYGHQLDPNPPIKVPGMSYQPPLIGYKKLLNFEVLSQPDVAGWFYIASGLILVGITYYEWKKK